MTKGIVTEYQILHNPYYGYFVGRLLIRPGQKMKVHSHDSDYFKFKYQAIDALNELNEKKRLDGTVS